MAKFWMSGVNGESLVKYRHREEYGPALEVQTNMRLDFGEIVAIRSVQKGTREAKHRSSIEAVGFRKEDFCGTREGGDFLWSTSGAVVRIQRLLRQTRSSFAPQHLFWKRLLFSWHKRIRKQERDCSLSHDFHCSCLLSIHGPEPRSIFGGNTRECSEKSANTLASSK